MPNLIKILSPVLELLNADRRIDRENLIGALSTLRLRKRHNVPDQFEFYTRAIRTSNIVTP
jgi:hypothetical protein